MVHVHEKLDSGYIVSYVQFAKEHELNYIIEKYRFFVKDVYDSYEKCK